MTDSDSDSDSDNDSDSDSDNHRDIGMNTGRDRTETVIGAVTYVRESCNR
jgi:hypothetical protein